MSAPFQRTIGAVESDGHGRTLSVLLCLSLLLAAAALWLGVARMSVYVVSDSARIEVDVAAHPVQVQLAGRVVSTTGVRLGDVVAAGEPLVELDASAERIELERTRAICVAKHKSLVARNAALQAETDALGDDAKAAYAAADAAFTRERAAQALADVANESSRLADSLSESAVLSRRELLRDHADAQEKKGLALALGSEAKLTSAERRVKLSDRVTALAERRVMIAELEGEVSECEGAAKRLEYEIGLRSIRAPVAGTVAELHPVTPGELLAAGIDVAAIVPVGAPRVVAEFVPGPSVGRVRSGQRTRVALDGFPWVQYGFVEGVVTHVATEPRAGKIRVECSVSRAPAGAKLVHGLPGRVEIVVEQLSPWLLLLRAAGQVVFEPDRSDAPVKPGLEPG